MFSSQPTTLWSSFLHHLPPHNLISTYYFRRLSGPRRLKLQNNHSFLLFPPPRYFIDTKRDSDYTIKEKQKKQNIWSHIKPGFKVAPCFWISKPEAVFPIPGKSLWVLTEWEISQAAPPKRSLKSPTLISVLVPVCSAADLCGSTGPGER